MHGQIGRITGMAVPGEGRIMWRLLYNTITSDQKVDIFEKSLHFLYIIHVVHSVKISIKSAKIKSFSVKMMTFPMKIMTFHMKISNVRENENFSRKCEL